MSIPPSLHRRTLLTSAGAIAALSALSALPITARAAPRKGAASRPNILFIMADDLGYADLSSFGRRDYQTPNLDRLAASGVKLTHAYSNSPVCSPTRTALITGRYQYRFPAGLEEPIAQRNIGLADDEYTLPSALRDAGYQTALVGKWHLGALPTYSPLKNGYQKFWGVSGGGVDYFTHSIGQRHDLWDGDQPAKAAGYLTDLIGQHSISAIEGFVKSDAPFFLSAHFTAPHWPWETDEDAEESRRIAAKEDRLALFHYDGGTLKTFAEMVLSLDRQVGRLLDTLDRLGLADNTLIVFTSDNGGERFSDTWPFSGRKSELLEGGIRVPTIVRWPQKFAAGTVNETPLLSMDWLPTLLAAAGAAPPKAIGLDGINALPALTGGSAPDRQLYWRFNNRGQKALREGRWKYLEISGYSFLFDIIEDPLERANLKEREPEIFARLAADWQKWNTAMLAYSPDHYTHGFTAGSIADRVPTAPKPQSVGQ